MTGWDGLVTDSPSQKALNQATAVIDALPESILHYCAIFPSNDTNIYFQGKFPCGRLTAYLDGEIMTYIIKSHNETIKSQKTCINAESMQQLVYTIEKHCLNTLKALCQKMI